MATTEESGRDKLSIWDTATFASVAWESLLDSVPPTRLRALSWSYILVRVLDHVASPRIDQWLQMT